MPKGKQHVVIKGVNEGLVFILSDKCDFDELIEELQHKITTTHQQILSGPEINVDIKLGRRVIAKAQEQQIRDILGQKGNLIIQSISTDRNESPDKEHTPPLKVIKGIVRSGQTISTEQSVLYLGDVNPGGTIISTGDIFVLGSLRGMAHAGVNGNEYAIIAASHLRPTQLRIADVISRPPDEWGIDEAFMEFAYLHSGHMEIDHMNQLHRIRPDRQIILGE